MATTTTPPLAQTQVATAAAVTAINTANASVQGWVAIAAAGIHTLRTRVVAGTDTIRCLMKDGRRFITTAPTGG